MAKCGGRVGHGPERNVLLNLGADQDENDFLTLGHRAFLDNISVDFKLHFIYTVTIYTPISVKKMKIDPMIEYQ